MKLELQKNTPSLKQVVVPTLKTFNFVVSAVNKWKKTQKNVLTVLVIIIYMKKITRF